jgi:hypothetical protein
MFASKPSMSTRARRAVIIGALVGAGFLVASDSIKEGGGK